MMPALPEGFTLDAPSGVPAGMPPLPPGFKLDSPSGEIQPPKVSKETLDKANKSYEQESGFMHGLRRAGDAFLMGWEPQVTAAVAPYVMDTTGRDIAAEEQAKLDRFQAEHPYASVASDVAGGGAGLLVGGGALRAIPATARALDVAGNVISRVPTAVGRGAAAGAAIGAPMGASQEIAKHGLSTDNALGGAAEGALGGALGGGLVSGAASAIGPWASDLAQKAVAAGAKPTIGQMVGDTGVLGRIAQRVEQTASGAPLVGQNVRNAWDAATESVNREVANRALRPIGQALPDSVKIGHDAADHVFTELGKAYDAILPNIRVNQLDIGSTSQWYQDMADLRRDAVANGIRDKGLNYLDSLISSVRDRLDKSVPQGGQFIPGNVVKKVESSLSSESRSLRRSTDASVNQVAPFADRMREVLRDLVQRTNPQYAPQLQAINNGYAIANVMRKASVLTTTNDGAFSAAQLNRAVKSQDSSVSKGQFARGLSLLQDLSGPSASIMRDFANSGTPERAATMAILTGSIGAVHPQALIAGAAIPAIYNPVVQAALRKLAAGAPAQRMALANRVIQLAPMGALTGEELNR